jgi:hypothetical protein
VRHISVGLRTFLFPLFHQKIDHGSWNMMKVLSCLTLIKLSQDLEIRQPPKLLDLYVIFNDKAVTIIEHVVLCAECRGHQYSITEIRYEVYVRNRIQKENHCTEKLK